VCVCYVSMWCEFWVFWFEGPIGVGNEPNKLLREEDDDDESLERKQ